MWNENSAAMAFILMRRPVRVANARQRPSWQEDTHERYHQTSCYYGPGYWRTFPRAPFVRGTTNPAVFFVQNGVARLLPDAATVKYMTKGQTVTTLTDVAMVAMSKGSPMPSLADGNLMTTFVAASAQMAVYMQNGLGRRVPDMTTITDLQNGGAPTFIALSAADFALVPQGGAPVPTRYRWSGVSKAMAKPSTPT